MFCNKKKIIQERRVLMWAFFKYFSCNQSPFKYKYIKQQKDIDRKKIYIKQTKNQLNEVPF